MIDHLSSRAVHNGFGCDIFELKMKIQKPCSYLEAALEEWHAEKRLIA